MDHEATMQMFSEYIDENKWNSQQIAFVRLYSREDQNHIMGIINGINENATRLVG